MNFEFSADQNLLRDQAQNFLRDRCNSQALRRVLEGGNAYDADLWQAMVDMGWTATTIPETYGGLGLSHLELCVLAEELGRVLAPTPFSSSVYLATEALMQFGSEAQKQTYLPKLAAGSLIGTIAVSEGTQVTTAGRLGATAVDGRLTGTKVPVPDGDLADFAIVIAKDSASTASLYLVDLSGANITRETVRTLDPTRNHARIQFADAAGELLGTSGLGWDQLSKLFDRAAVLFAWEQVGGAEAALHMARDYAMGRYAFGRPIAAFQAIKHKLADMYIAHTLARSNSYYGAWALGTDAPELPVAAATARVSATEAFHNCAQENIQTHGGMGFTWEFDCHLYYRRARLLSVNLGALPRWKDKLVSRLEQSNRST